MWSMWSSFIVKSRSLHTAVCPLMSSKDLRFLKKMRRRRSEEYYRRIDSANPFKHQIGIANSLKYMDLNPNDPGYEKDVLLQGPEEEEIERLGDEVSVKRQKSVDKHYKQKLSKDEVKHLMEVTKLFPKPKDPNLLTWIEKETIRHLNKVEPNTWTVQALAESFPSADEIVIKKILKSKTISPDRIKEHDDEVRLNWKLLRKNRLSIREDLKSHILSNCGGSLKQPDVRLLPQELTSKVIQNCNEKFQPLPPKIKKGPFGSIISDYKNKVRSLNPEKNVGLTEEEDVHVVKSLFKPDQLIYDEANINEPSPYRDTALLDTSINLANEPHMTADEFKEIYFKSKANRESIALALKTETNPLKIKYFEWLQEENFKSSQEIKVEKLNVDDILQEIK